MCAPSAITDCPDTMWHNCSNISTCVLVNGSQPFECVCNAGYTGNDTLNGGDCYDIDECRYDMLNNCSDFSTCHNTNGSYTCDCWPGFIDGSGGGGNVSAPTPLVCQDIDECQHATLNNCTSNVTCNNTYGSFRCLCKVGFTENASIGCTDIDECQDTSACPSNSICFNTNGSFLCHCNAGFTGDSSPSSACLDINECAEKSHNCPLNSLCFNTLGGFSCGCSDSSLLPGSPRCTGK